MTITLASSNPDQGSLSQTSLTFTASNWNVAQTVTVTGLDDHIVNGDQTYQITGTAASNDANYNGMSMTPVTVTNTEADATGITVAPTSIITTQSGGTATFSVAITSRPSAAVRISLSSTDPTQGSLSTSFLVFNPGNWNAAQTVTVTGLNSGSGSDQVYQIDGTASSSDANYNGLTITPVTVTNKQTDTAGIERHSGHADDQRDRHDGRFQRHPADRAHGQCDRHSQ